LLFAYGLSAQALRYSRDSSGIRVFEGEKPVLYYQARPLSAHGQYSRANYIHPLFGLNGEILTEDFPDDHPHHRGVFWAWHQVLADTLALGDSWECRDFDCDVYDIRVTPADTSLAINSSVFWKSPVLRGPDGLELPVARENTEIRICPRTRGMRVIDFKISILALVPNLRLGGSQDEKGYGGFSVRMKLPDGIRFYSEQGQILPRENAVLAGTWMNITGPIGVDGKTAGLLIFEGGMSGSIDTPWILREKGSMQNAVFPGRNPVGLSMESPTVLRYRLVVYEGSLSPVQITSLKPKWQPAGKH
jgi:hypothetical protein